MTAKINGWNIAPGTHPAAAAIWSIFDESPEVFGGSIENYGTARQRIEQLSRQGLLDRGTIGEVLGRLDQLTSVPQGPPGVMREAEAAKYLGVSVRTLKRWCVVEDLPHRTVADKRLYSKAALDQWASGQDTRRLQR